MTKLNILFTNDAWLDYLKWEKTDKATVKKIDKLIMDTIRHPFTGLGKPEPLQHDLSGFWSRRINHKDRMVYAVTKSQIQIIQLRYHYSK